MKDKIEIQFAKLNKNAKIPTKDEANLGYDIYACFEEDFKIIYPNETVLIPTGLASIIPDGYGIILKDRGSTGSKGLVTACGVIDSNYRGEWFVALHNDNKVPIVILKGSTLDFLGDCYRTEIIAYPYDKAITQAIIIENIPSITKEISIEELQSNKTERGDGALGSSGK